MMNIITLLSQKLKNADNIVDKTGHMHEISLCIIFKKRDSLSRSRRYIIGKSRFPTARNYDIKNCYASEALGT